MLSKVSIVLPDSPNLNIQALSVLFKNTSASYKYYWFLSLLDAVARRGKPTVSADELTAGMIAKAWYPLNLFKLSFGIFDSLGKVVADTMQATELSAKTNESELREAILERMAADADFRRTVRQLQKCVPFKLLSPWTGSKSDAEVVRASADFASTGVLYELIRERGTMTVRVHDAWVPYLVANYTVLRDFAYWNLLGFVQQRNPLIPNIADKLVQSGVRASLANQKKFWDTAMHAGAAINCIYTGREMTPGGYDLDHFLPWSFIAHDQLWNLTPSDSSINSSKSDKLPILDCFLEKLVAQQQDAVRAVLKKGCNLKVLDDFLSLGFTPQQMAQMEFATLMESYTETFVPLEQIARNTGFEIWNYRGR